MGHYRAELSSPFENTELARRYDKQRTQELLDVIRKNPYDLAHASIGDRVTWYEGLLVPSAVSITPEYKPASQLVENLHLVMNSLAYRYASKLIRTKGAVTIKDKAVENGFVYLNTRGTGPIGRIRSMPADPRYFQKKE